MAKAVAMKNLFKIFLMMFFFVFGCNDAKNKIPYSKYEEGEELLVGNLGVNSKNSNAFGFEVPGLSFQGKAKFAVGNSLFNQSWVSAPASTTARDGLGPTFNARACATCHFKDGRGKPLLKDRKTAGFLMRLSKQGVDEHGGPLGVPNYGVQIHDRSNRDIPFEAKSRLLSIPFTDNMPMAALIPYFVPTIALKMKILGK